MILSHPNHNNQGGIQSSFFPLFEVSGARVLVAVLMLQSVTRQRCDAKSSCKHNCTVFGTPVVSFVEHGLRSPFF